jgi:hypothetical protein
MGAEIFPVGVYQVIPREREAALGNEGRIAHGHKLSLLDWRSNDACEDARDLLGIFYVAEVVSCISRAERAKARFM